MVASAVVYNTSIVYFAQNYGLVNPVECNLVSSPFLSFNRFNQVDIFVASCYQVVYVIFPTE